MTRNAVRTIVAILLVCAAVIGFSGINVHPLDRHEAFVAETAAEMVQRGNWIVPYFNGEMRLAKPPLAYWLTALVAWADGSLPSIEPWHARLPSVLAGIGSALLVFYLGLRIYCPRVGVVAMALFITSSGYFSATHDARVDMQYSFWILAAFAAFVATLRAHHMKSAAPPWRPLLMWACLGLATLSKGPHIPLLLVAAQILYVSVNNQTRKDFVRLLRPVAGLAIYVLIALPWWCALASQIGYPTLTASQLGGNLLRPSASDLFSLYYIKHLLLLALPWLPVCAFAPFLKGAPTQNENGIKGSAILVFPVAIILLGLAFGSQMREVYLLPILPLIWLLVASRVAHFPFNGRPLVPLTTSVALALQTCVVGAVAVWFLIANAEYASVMVMVTMAVTVAAAIATIAAIFSRTWKRSCVAFAGNVLLATVAWTALAGTALLWGEERFDKPRLAQMAQAVITDGMPVAAFHVHEGVFVYYTHHKIFALDDLQEITDLFNRTRSESIGLFTIGSALVSIRERFIVDEISYMKNGSNTITFVLLRQKPELMKLSPTGS